MPDKAAAALSLHLGAVILAGGRSRRMGEWKPALAWLDGKKLLEAHISAFSPRAGAGIVCALPEERRAEAAEKLRLGIALPEWIADPDAPPFATLAQALRALIAQAVSGLEGAWATPVDAPPASPATLDAMARAAASNPDLWAARPSTLDAAGNRRAGHPVLLRRAAVDALLKMDPASARLDKFLSELSEQRSCFVEVHDPLIVADLNEPAEYKTALQAALSLRNGD
jgi:CTP:molybdopterin cytidylyltransferase MocA